MFQRAWRGRDSKVGGSKPGRRVSAGMARSVSACCGVVARQAAHERVSASGATGGRKIR